MRQNGDQGGYDGGVVQGKRAWSIVPKNAMSHLWEARTQTTSGALQHGQKSNKIAQRLEGAGATYLIGSSDGEDWEP